MKGLISVIVSTYNKPEYLALTLRSLGAQTDLGFEVIVANDGSDGRTKSVVDQESGRLGLVVKCISRRRLSCAAGFCGDAPE